MRVKKHPDQLELDFTAPLPPPPFTHEDAMQRARELKSKQRLLGQRWWYWVQRTLEHDPHRIEILCALSVCRH